MAKKPGGAMLQSAEATQSQLIPVLTKWKDIGKKSELAPMVVTIVTVLLLFVFLRSPVISYDYQYVVGDKMYGGTIFTSVYLILICLYLMLLSLYFIRRVAGKDKSWLLLLGVGVFTGYLLWLFQTEHDFRWMYNFFHGTLAGGEPLDDDEVTQTFVKHFLGTGFFEEMFKAIPLFLIMIAGSFMPGTIRAKFGIEEPLDGILLGAASGGGFAFMETIGQYISRQLVREWRYSAAVNLHGLPFNHQIVNLWISKLTDKQVDQLTAQGQIMLGWQPGLSLLIPRSLGEAFGHMAYAGCFGYFIGLAVLKPQQRWKILAIGLASSSLLHALWDTIDSNVLLCVVAVLSYAVLAAGILKAREISPNRAQLMPSIFVGALSPSPSVVAAYAASPNAAGGAFGVVSPAMAADTAVKVEPGPNPLPNGTASLRIGSKYLVIVPGLRLMSHQIPGLQAQTAEGLVAEVTRNPNDPEVLGLTNLSTTIWEVVTTSSTRREIQPGQTVKLSPGTKIDFGETDGEVR